MGISLKRKKKRLNNINMFSFYYKDKNVPLREIFQRKQIC